MVKIELVYSAYDGTSFYKAMTLPLGTTVGIGIDSSHIIDVHPEIVDFPVGIYSKIVSKDTILRDGDRIEIYRSLRLCPKEKRRKLAHAKKKSTLSSTKKSI